MGSKISKKKMKMNGFKNLKKKDENEWVKKSQQQMMNMNGFKNLKSKDEMNGIKYIFKKR
jgi:hypothetical protein